MSTPPGDPAAWGPRRLGTPQVGLRAARSATLWRWSRRELLALASASGPRAPAAPEGSLDFPASPFRLLLLSEAVHSALGCLRSHCYLYTCVFEFVGGGGFSVAYVAAILDLSRGSFLESQNYLRVNLYT